MVDYGTRCSANLARGSMSVVSMVYKCPIAVALLIRIGVFQVAQHMRGRQREKYASAVNARY